MPENENTPTEYPIDGTLDLHTFQPKEVKQLVPDYIDACLEKKIYQIRIIHGKGTGTLRRTVQSILEKHPAVLRFRHQGGSGGGWGATVVDLKANDI
ncbi:MAG: Smr/MutS family protein [candidate division Zixibacteria bacterium]